MNIHPALKPGNVAVITGAADGIGLAAAKKYASLGMRVCMVDNNTDKLSAASTEVNAAMAEVVDVADIEQLRDLKSKVFDTLGQIDVLMNNPGIGRPTDSWTEYDNWQTVLRVNLGGVINGVQTFTQAMIEQASPGLIINTGSKQGITSPPGNPAYNVSKAGVKTLTESLQHSLRNTDNCQLSAHLLVPGFTYTGMIQKFVPEKPDGAWSAEQVIDFMIASISRGDFYVLCPDNDVSRELDNKRMEWAMGDLIHNRPPLSRWHPDFGEDFHAFVGEN